MATLTRTERRERLLIACRDGHVRWDPRPDIPASVRWSGWVIAGVRRTVQHADAIELTFLSLHSLTHKGDSQEITAAGEALLRGWTQ
jgi:hypothetical protein